MKVRLIVAYRGESFHGFAANEGVRTVAGELSAALGRVMGSSVDVACAGRTDRGVHAWGQVVTFEAPDDVDLPGLARSVTRQLQPEVVVRRADVVPPTFDARHSALSRTYRYSIDNSPIPNPFTAESFWHVAVPLNLRAMAMAADSLIGEHDFSSYCRAVKVGPGEPERSLVRRVRRAQWRARPELGEGALEFEISANAFCHQMVRSVVGTLVDVGRGRRKAGEMMGILAARSRDAAGGVAPPHGLCLWEVEYPSETVQEHPPGANER